MGWRGSLISGFGVRFEVEVEARALELESVPVMHCLSAVRMSILFDLVGVSGQEFGILRLLILRELIPERRWMCLLYRQDVRLQFVGLPHWTEGCMRVGGRLNGPLES